MKHSKKIAALLAAALTVGAYLTTVGAAAPGGAAAPSEIPRSHTLAASVPAFADVPSGAWYENEVKWCVGHDIMDGITDTSFEPETDMVRSTVALAIWRAAGRPEAASSAQFSDMPSGAGYAAAVSWTAEQEIMTGYGGGVFGSADPVSREDLATALWRYAKEPAADAGTDFADETRISNYAATAVDWARANEILNGRPGNVFDPKATVTRAEVSAVLYRYLNNGGGASITTNGGEVIALSALEHQSESGSTVYYLSDITPEAMVEIYEALEWSPTGKVAVKLSTGEPPNSNYLRPELIKDVVQGVDGTIVENNTAYGGSRSETAMHYQVAKDHGFNDIADVVILDENGSMSLPVEGGSVLSENLVGAHFADYDSYLVLSHFKGHAMAGFGGAIKNISIGLGSAEGKCLIHTGGQSHTSPWGGDQTAFTESMAEAGKSVSDYLGNGERIVYINVMNRISIDCDCDGNPHEPDIHDIGILASADPVALDQACIDIVSQAQGCESLMQRIERQNGIHTLEHAQDIGLGSRTYALVNIDN